MIDAVITDRETGKFLWLDVTNPSQEELRQLETDYGLHPTWMQDCVETGHLPKLEKIQETTFLIVRGFDQSSVSTDDNFRRITGKVAFFLGNRFLITLHRQDQPFLRQLREQFRDTKEDVFLQVILLEIILGAMESYHPLLHEAEVRIEEFEQAVLDGKLGPEGWREILRTKSRLSIAKRMLIHSLHVVQRFHPSSGATIPFAQDVRERIDGLIFFADHMLDELISLQNVQLSLASHRLNESTNRTNEVMRLLTVFSLFFLPLNFIVGIYGMNFEYMPEVKWRHGYHFVWAILLATVAGLYVWFRRQGWLHAYQEASPSREERRKAFGDRRKR